jgi:hypothetical protein
MIGRLLKWNRLLVPPWWAVAIFLAFWLFLEAAYLYAGFAMRPPGSWWLNPSGDDPQFAHIRETFIGIAVLLYTAYRVGFHPAYRKDYRDWLASTPWTAKKPLPLGPVYLLPQDMAALAILLILLHTAGEPSLLLIFGFFFLYELAIAATLMFTGDRWLCYGLLSCLSIALRFAKTGWFGIAIVLVVYPLAYWAILQSLARFPWRTKDARHHELIKIDIVETSAGARTRLGFPYQFLAPKQTIPSVSLAEGTAISLLAGAWAHAALSLCPDAESRTGTSIIVCVAPASIATLIRIIRYCGNYWPPISVLGRLATGRIIVQRYDRVLVAPLLSFLVLFLGMNISMPDRAVGTWDMPLVMTVCLWLTLSLGPSLQEWRLTGGHRLGLGIRSRQLFAEP